MGSSPAIAESVTGPFDVVIIGSGPAGVAVAERLYEDLPDVTIALIERGSTLLRRHFYANGASISERDRFLTRYRVCPWKGDLSEGGALLPALGGRGIVGGSQLHRFYTCDFTLWPNGLWPLDEGDLDPYFREAEIRLLAGSRSGGPAQDHVCKTLADLNARHPPCGPTLNAERGPNGGVPHRSSVQRLLALLDSDRVAPTRRLRIFAGTRALRMVEDTARPRRISRVRCVSVGGFRVPIGAQFDVQGTYFVLAASAVESARLVLASGLETLAGYSSNVGKYLTEHIYCRGYLDVSGREEMTHGSVNVFIPPRSTDLENRFQIELCSVTNASDGRSLLRVTGSAAMDPQPDNRVTLSSSCVDGHGMPRALTVLRLSPGDERRQIALLHGLQSVAERLGCGWLAEPEVLPRGASYHEAGTLRIAHSPLEGAAAPDGLLFGLENVFTGDGSAFPSVGVANPILTLTAMGYRLASRLNGLLRACEHA